MSLEITTAPSANNVTNWTALPIAFTLERGNVNFLKFQITSELSMSFNEHGGGWWGEGGRQQVGEVELRVDHNEKVLLKPV